MLIVPIKDSIYIEFTVMVKFISEHSKENIVRISKVNLNNGLPKPTVHSPADVNQRISSSQLPKQHVHIIPRHLLNPLLSERPLQPGPFTVPGHLPIDLNQPAKQRTVPSARPQHNRPMRLPRPRLQNRFSVTRPTDLQRVKLKTEYGVPAAVRRAGGDEEEGADGRQRSIC